MTNKTAAVPKTQKPLLTLKQITLAGLMTAVFCLLGPLSLNIPISPVPISLGMLALYFVTSVLGMKLGTFSVLAYILLGLAGLPVFTGFTGGAGKLLGPTGGYIIGYIFMALICGFFVDKWGNRLIMEILGMVLGTAVTCSERCGWLIWLPILFTRRWRQACFPIFPWMRSSWPLRCLWAGRSAPGY